MPDTEKPTFSIESVQLQFSLNRDLQTIRVADDHMALFQSHQVTLIDLNNPSQVKHIPLPEPFGAAFIDPSGTHLLYQANSLNCYYLHTPSYLQFKPLHKFKGAKRFRHVEFTPSVQSNITGDFLITTENGVYVGFIKTHSVAESNKKDDKYFKSVFKEDSIITAQYQKSFSQIVVVSQSKLYTWDTFDTTAGELSRVFKTTPVTSQLESTSWLVANSPDHSYLLVDSHSPHRIVSDDDEMQIQQINIDAEIGDLCVSDHHIICLARDSPKINTANKLSGDVIEVELPKSSGYKLAADASKKTYWVYDCNQIYELVVENESIQVWHDYYKLGKYQQALACLANEPEVSFKRDMVKIRQGYSLLQEGGFGVDLPPDSEAMGQQQIEGIQILAESSEPFEKVCLMLLQYGPEAKVSGDMSRRLLVEYLQVKYRQARQANHHIRMVVLSSWIIEEMLTTLSRSQDRAGSEEQFRKFLQQNYRYLDQDTVYQIISNLHFHNMLVYYADLIEDYRYIIFYYLDRNEWGLALASVAKVFFSSTHDNQLVYDTSTTLLLNYPEGTIDTWLKLQSAETVTVAFDPVRVLPALLTYNREARSVAISENKAIAYLGKVIYDKQIRSDVINNTYLMLLLAYNRDEEMVTKLLMKFLHHGVEPYNSQMILRMCMANNQFQAAVWVLIGLGLYDQALDVSIRYRLPKLAEFVIRKYDDDNQEESEGLSLSRSKFAVRKRLGLDYAGYLIKQVDSEEVNEFIGIDEKLNKSKRLNQILRWILDLDSQLKTSGTITLKDLLPMLPDSVIINDFRDEIVNSLNNYNNSINQLSVEMNDSLMITARLKQKIRELTSVDNKATVASVIQPGEPCRICQKLLLSTKSILYFPNCHHGFHKECVVRTNIDSGNYQFRKVFDSFKRNPALVTKDELEKLLTQGCILCSDHNISTIDAPLVVDEQWNI